jgi:hypothetical protein
MSREKKSQVDDIIKLRKILDNPSDPVLKNLIAEDEKALDSIRRHLGGSIPAPTKKTDYAVRRSVSLEPKVTVYPKIRMTQQPTTVLPSFQLVSVQPPSFQTPSPSGLPEFELASTTSSIQTPAQTSVSFVTEELYEVEKVEPTIVQFSEVTSSKPVGITTMKSSEPSVSEGNLPEWEPVSETQFEEPQEKQGASAESSSPPVQPPVESTLETPRTHEEIPEFERVEPSPAETVERPEEWEILSKPSQEAPKEFTAVEPSETVSPSLTQRQQRAAKKEAKRKEREAKKHKKIELKQLQKETREKEWEARLLTEERQSDQPQPEPQQGPSPPTETKEPPEMKIDTTVFAGVESIDRKTAELLTQNGYFSLETLGAATIDDLVQIRGIKRKLAKQIKKEVQQKLAEQPQLEFIPLKEKAHKTKLKKTSEDIGEWESYHVEDHAEAIKSRDICVYHGYTLYKRRIRNAGGKTTTVHFFRKEKPAIGDPTPLPRGYRIIVNKKTGVPSLRKNT